MKKTTVIIMGECPDPAIVKAIQGVGAIVIVGGSDDERQKLLTAEAGNPIVLEPDTLRSASDKVEHTYRTMREGRRIYVDRRTGLECRRNGKRIK